MFKTLRFSSKKCTSSAKVFGMVRSEVILTAPLLRL